MDKRIETLAKNLVGYSTNVKKGENVLISIFGEDSYKLVQSIIREVYKVGANPFVVIKNNTILREILIDCKKEQLKLDAEIELEQMKKMDVFIGIRSSKNITELGDVPSEKMNMYFKAFDPVVEYRVNNTRWVVLRYPNYSMAQLANTSLDAFEDFYFKVCNLDYEKMSHAMDNLVKYMNRTDKVRIKGEGTDLEFSIKGIPAIKCAGEFNIPDGEVFTAPVKESVNGTLSYNCPAVYQGYTFENIKLRFENGKIVEASANDSQRINKVFDTDQGGRFIGEFAIGVNPYILKPMKDTLFDEKIMGSFHFPPGRCYEDAPNGNESSIHWDLVCIQTKDYGGGEIYFDDVLIRKDGIFVVEELKALNPENLK